MTNKAAAALGRLGGKKKAAKMTKAERVEMARKMTAARLAKRKAAPPKTKRTRATMPVPIPPKPPRARSIKEPWVACKVCGQSWANNAEGRSDLADHWCFRAM